VTKNYNKTSEPSANNTIVETLHRIYQDFSKQEKRVADVILDAPGELGLYSASELAERANVSNATITRFVRRAQFSSYEELRLAAREARSWGSPLFQTGPVTSTGDNDFLSEFLKAETHNLAQALNSLVPSEIDEMAEALIAARNLVFMGFRNSHFLASYARNQFLQFRSGTRISPGPGETITESTADLTSEDVVLVIGLRRILSSLKSEMASLHDRGVPILLLTDPSARVVPAFARWTLTCPVESPYLFDSYSGVQSVLRILAYKSFQKSGKRGRAYMQAIEARHAETGAFE
jgi:DNA-binding MurR/RpiR family transcriptional regulator